MDGASKVVSAMCFPSRAIPALVLLLFFSVPLQSWAGDSQFVSVTVDGQPLSESLTLGAMLCKSPSVTEPYNQGVEIAGLQDALPPVGEGGVWTYAPYRWGGGFVDDQFRFSGFYGALPESFRIAVYRPSKERIYISNEVQVHSLLNRYRVDLCGDGTATLSRDDTWRWLADVVLGIAGCGLLVTLLLTLFVQCAVVTSGVLLVKQKSVLPRVLAVCALLNCVACPIIWGGVPCSILGWRFMGGGWCAGSRIFAGSSVRGDRVFACRAIWLESGFGPCLGRQCHCVHCIIRHPVLGFCLRLR